MISIWNQPDSVKKSNIFDVFIKNPDEKTYRQVFCQHIFTGHQKGEFSPSSMTVFDFDGKVEVKVVFHGGKIHNADLRPHSYRVDAMISENENALYFTLEQKEEAPRKMILRINDDWEKNCLHLLTNPIEKNRPSKMAANVLVIPAGCEVPEVLPEGKNTYYFEEGIHELPKGLWAELDLGKDFVLNRFELLQGDFQLSDCYVDEKKRDPLSFQIEIKEKKDEAYTLLYDGRNNVQSGVISGTFAPVSGRFVRIRLFGTTLKQGWIFSCILNEVRLFSPDSDQNVALGKACDGAIPSFRNLTDGNPETLFTSRNRCANWHAGESFFLSRPGTHLYLAPGAVLKGSIAADDISDLSITGRGILDSSELHHENPNPGEARTGAIWLTGGSDYLIEGITVLDAPMWQIVLNYSRNVCVKNINLLGYVVNADGIHLSGCENASVEGSFVRTCDDLIVIYHYGATRQILIKNCVFLNDDAHVFLFGLGETKNAAIENIVIEDCDILSQQEAPWHQPRFSGVFKFWAHGGNRIENIRVSRVRIDPFRDPSKGCVLQFRTEYRFDGENPGKSIRHVLFEDLEVEAEGESPSLIRGITPDHDISDVVFKNYRRAGRVVTNTAEANLCVEGSVESVCFCPPDTEGLC